MFAAEDFFILVGGEGFQAHVLVVAFQEMHIVFLLLQAHHVLDDALAVGTAVDVVAKKVKLAVLRHFEHILKQRFEGLGATVNVGDDPALWL